MVKAQNQPVAPIARDEPIFRGLLYYISSDDAETETTGRQDKGFPEALKSRMDELDAQIAILERITEQQKPKVGRGMGTMKLRRAYPTRPSTAPLLCQSLDDVAAKIEQLTAFRQSGRSQRLQKRW